MAYSTKSWIRQWIFEGDKLHLVIGNDGFKIDLDDAMALQAAMTIGNYIQQRQG